MADINGGDDETYSSPEAELVEESDTAAADAEIADLKARIGVLEDLKADQAKKIAALESEAARLGKDLEESMAAAAAGAAKLRQLRPEAEALCRGKAEAESKVKGLKEDLAQLESEKVAAETRIAAGLAEIETLKSEIGDLSAQLKNSAASKEIIDELSRELEELKNKYSEILNDKLEVEARNGEDHHVKPTNFALSGQAIAATTTGAVAVGLVACFAYSKSRR